MSIVSTRLAGSGSHGGCSTNQKAMYITQQTADAARAEHDAARACASSDVDVLAASAPATETTQIKAANTTSSSSLAEIT